MHSHSGMKPIYLRQSHSDKQRPLLKSFLSMTVITFLPKIIGEIQQKFIWCLKKYFIHPQCIVYSLGSSLECIRLNNTSQMFHVRGWSYGRCLLAGFYSSSWIFGSGLLEESVNGSQVSSDCWSQEIYAGCAKNLIKLALGSVRGSTRFTLRVVAEIFYWLKRWGRHGNTQLSSVVPLPRIPKTPC